MWLLALYLHINKKSDDDDWVVGCCEGVVYLSSPGHSADNGLQLGKASYSL